MHHRCEGTLNCNDKSDEDNCDPLIIDKEVYNTIDEDKVDFCNKRGY